MGARHSQVEAVSPGLGLNLARTMRTDEAVRIVMRRLHDMLRVNEAGVLAGVDAEFLHDFGITVRRSRSLLRQMSGVIPQRILRRLDSGFAWLSQITRAARDLDVYLIVLDTEVHQLAPDAGQDLSALREFFRQRHQLAHKQLAVRLTSARYTQLIAAWSAYLASPLPVRSKLPFARLWLADFADRAVWRALRRVLRQGRAIRPDSQPTALHDLRKSCKALRYLMEFFQSLYPAARITKAIRILKSLQDWLGVYQDTQMQQIFLETFLQQSKGSTDGQTELDNFKHRLDKRQAVIRKRLTRKFEAFSERKSQSEFRRLFKPRRSARTQPSNPAIS